MNMAELEALTLKPFPSNKRREKLFMSFNSWYDSLITLGLQGVIWVDGSFLTEKSNPSDIDIVSINLTLTRQLTPLENSELSKLLNHNHVKTVYDLDYYMEQPSLQKLVHREAYWKGFFGFQHDRISAKGFVEIVL